MCRTGAWGERSDSEVRRPTEPSQTTLTGALFTILGGSRRSPRWNIKLRSTLRRRIFSIKTSSLSRSQTRQTSSAAGQMKTTRRQVKSQLRSREKRQPRPQYFQKIMIRKTQCRGVTPTLAARSRPNRNLCPVWVRDISRQRNRAPGMIGLLGSLDIWNLFDWWSNVNQPSVRTSNSNLENYFF